MYVTMLMEGCAIFLNNFCGTRWKNAVFKITCQHFSMLAEIKILIYAVRWVLQLSSSQPFQIQAPLSQIHVSWRPLLILQHHKALIAFILQMAISNVSADHLIIWCRPLTVHRTLAANHCYSWSVWLDSISNNHFKQDKI